MPDRPCARHGFSNHAIPLVPAAASYASGSAEPSAQVDISNTAATVMSGVDGATSEFDSEKVARITQAIADGKFTVNPEAIADKLIANAQELLGKASH